MWMMQVTSFTGQLFFWKTQKMSKYLDINREKYESPEGTWGFLKKTYINRYIELCNPFSRNELQSDRTSCPSCCKWQTQNALFMKKHKKDSDGLVMWMMQVTSFTGLYFGKHKKDRERKRTEVKIPEKLHVYSFFFFSLIGLVHYFMVFFSCILNILHV